jgi:hypothetical protein
MPDTAGTIQQIADLQWRAKPLIRVAAGQIDVLTDQAEEALMAAEADIFQRAEHLVRPGYCEVSAADGRTTNATGLHCTETPGVDRGTGSRGGVAVLGSPLQRLEAR